ncbi:MAG: Serine/threonine protein kinase PrkC, regulator of stationary phase [Labilithrix sp.]|nr:Serine/threonine protein kinase PrkC, regulator of stationary phase [Labilithrix sp.]
MHGQGAQLEGDSHEAFGMDGMPSRFGKYTLIRKLATGGMAELFLAIQKSVAGFEKLLVIKRILPSMNQDRAFIEMLLHEARIAATLSHPNIVQIFDVGQQDGQYFIAMEHVHGEDLRSIVRQMKKKDVLEFPLEHALAIVLGMCAGLSYAHEKHELDGSALNIVHRDISPQNVVVTFTGDVKIVDFGIAKSDNRSGESTKSGKLKGKVPYMSPEQARGEVIDARSDVFSTGVMLFELTTGKRLFRGSSEYETLRLICERDYPRPRDVRADYPPGLEAIVMKSLAKDARDRYQSAREMQADLETFVRQHQIAVSHIALNQFMQALFEDKLALQKEMLLQGKQLADIIEMQHAMTAHDGQGDVDASGRHAASTNSMPAAARTLTDIAAQPHRSRGAGLAMGALGGVLLLAAVGGTAGYLATRKDPASASTLATTGASATPAVVKGAITLESDPPGASIWINGDLRAEVTPATITALPTAVPLDVKLTLDGFEQSREQLTLKADEPAKVHSSLKRGSVVADVKVAPESAAAAFAVDGKPVSGPRIEGITSSVSHKLVVSAPGFVEQTLSFSGNPMETKRLEVTLEKAPEIRHAAGKATGGPAPAVTSAGGVGKINVGASGGWCNVTIDGATRGATPVAGIELPAGPHKVTCTTPDGKMQSATVPVTADGTARYRFTL